MIKKRKGSWAFGKVKRLPLQPFCRQLKIQRKNPGNALLMRIGVAAMSHMHNGNNGSEVVGRSHQGYVL